MAKYNSTPGYPVAGSYFPLTTNNTSLTDPAGRPDPFTTFLHDVSTSRHVHWSPLVTYRCVCLPVPLSVRTDVGLRVVTSGRHDVPPAVQPSVLFED